MPLGGFSEAVHASELALGHPRVPIGTPLDELVVFDSIHPELALFRRDSETNPIPFSGGIGGIDVGLVELVEPA